MRDPDKVLNEARDYVEAINLSLSALSKSIFAKAFNGSPRHTKISPLKRN